MHEYLRAVGFSKIKDKDDLNQLLEYVEESYQSEKTAENKDGREFSERKKEFAPKIGIMLRGEYNDQEKFQRDYYFPYFEGSHEKFYEDVVVERHAEKESYAGVCDDLSLGVSIIFYLQNVSDYLNEKRMSQLTKCTVTLRLSGLSIEGKVLLPIVKKEIEDDENSDAIFQRIKLIQAAREGDEEAIENLTLEDMDTYSMISKRIGKEDVLSIVSTYFMPYGVECDHYNILGEILECKLVENNFSKEEIYILKVESHEVIFEICINKEDMLGEPAVGRRFKSVVWLQGAIVFHG